MNVRASVDTPVMFSPAILTGDPLANYWLRQVTLRMRREVSWLWHERGVNTRAEDGVLPPFIEPVQASLDMSRFSEEKRRFFQTDTTARYLSDLLRSEPPQVKSNPPQGSFSWVIDTLILDDLETFFLALGLAAAFDSAMGSVIAVCVNDPTKTEPSFALLQKLWDEPSEVLRVADLDHTLFRLGLLQFRGRNAVERAELNWSAPVCVTSLVAHQLLFPNATLPPCLVAIRRVEEGEIDVTETARLVAVRLQAAEPDHMCIVPIRGPKGSAHVECVQAISHVTNQAAVSYQAAPGLLQRAGYLDSLATVCWLKGVSLFLDESLVSTLSTDNAAQTEQILPQPSIPITVFLGVNDRKQIPKLPERYLLPIVDVPEFAYQDRMVYWKSALGDKAQDIEASIAENARRFRYGKETIDRVCTGLRSLPGAITPQDLVAAARAELELDIGDLAQKVTPRFRDEKLILPRKQEMLFQEVINAMNSLTEVHYEWGTAKAWNEGGIAVLFTGSPGTGKTMAAEIMAIELDLPMFRIDLSQVVNKYIGETEKNLKRLFDAADVSDIVLFFDEADALFGQRTEVKDAHDRYANLEISYLLERMERFKGLAILASNRKKDLDEAFLRRLRYIVDFPLPDVEQRKMIWLQVTPDAVDTSAVDFNFLARQFRLAGGHIRSIVFNACLQSANGDRSSEKTKARLTMEDMIVAVKREYDKLKRPLSLELFGPYASIVEDIDRA